jgi:hypothetical protein
LVHNYSGLLATRFFLGFFEVLASSTYTLTNTNALKRPASSLAASI